MEIKQQETYCNMLNVKNEPESFLNQLIATEIEDKSQYDPFIVKRIVISNLLTITDIKIAEYTELIIEEINRMDVNYLAMISTLRKNKSKLNKNKFISIIQNELIDDFIGSANMSSERLF